MSPAPVPTVDAEVCILGAGPHGLATAAALVAASPTLGRQLVVLDPSGSWLAAWHDAFARLEIEHLRSPLVHHPDVRPGALDRHIRRRRLARSGLPYDPPTTTAFASFCRELERRHHLAPPLAATSRRIRASRRGLTVDAGCVRVDARRVVLATNPHRRVIPPWTGPLLGHAPGLVGHAADVDLRCADDLAGRRVLVVGGGLTAAHLALGSARRGAAVTLLARRPLEVRAFDTDPGWLGPKRLRGFEAEPDPSARLAAVRAARGGGTMPAWMRERLAQLESDGRLRLLESRRVISAHATGGTAHLELDDASVITADRVWLATGTVPDLAAARGFDDLTPDVVTADGLPVADPDLRVGAPPLFVTGRLAALTLGPAAGNLWGAQRAARRITRALTGIDPVGDEVGPAPPPPGPRTQAS